MLMAGCVCCGVKRARRVRILEREILDILAKHGELRLTLLRGWARRGSAIAGGRHHSTSRCSQSPQSAAWLANTGAPVGQGFHLPDLRSRPSDWRRVDRPWRARPECRRGWALPRFSNERKSLGANRAARRARRRGGKNRKSQKFPAAGSVRVLFECRLAIFVGKRPAQVLKTGAFRPQKDTTRGQ